MVSRFKVNDMALGFNRWIYLLSLANSWSKDTDQLFVWLFHWVSQILNFRLASEIWSSLSNWPHNCTLFCSSRCGVSWTWGIWFRESKSHYHRESQSFCRITYRWVHQEGVDDTQNKWNYWAYRTYVDTKYVGPWLCSYQQRNTIGYAKSTRDYHNVYVHGVPSFHI